jgi:hypothetical protein
VGRRLHDMASARDADLLVIGASRADEIYRELVGDDARELLNNPPCEVAVVGRSVDLLVVSARSRAAAVSSGRASRSDWLTHRLARCLWCGNKAHASNKMM